MERFKSDANALSRFGSKHPGIVKPYGYFIKEEDGEQVPYLVMEFLEGNSIGHELQRGKGFTEEDIRTILMSTGSVLDFMHTENGKPLIYRDLKPGNIIIMPEYAEWPHKLVDFSESKIGNATFSSGSVLGTPFYSAPEQFGGGEADPSTDRYSLANIGIAMALQDENKLKELWFNAITLRALHAEGSLPVSDELLKVFEKATERERENRYQNFPEMMSDLGYNISRAPRTRQELEFILKNGRNSNLPVQVETTKPKTSLENKVEEGTKFGLDEGALVAGAVTLAAVTSVVTATAAGVVASAAAGVIGAVAAGVIGAVAAGVIGAVAAGTGVVAGGVGAAMVGELIRLDGKHHAEKGALYGGIGAGINILQACFLPIPETEKIILGLGIQGLASLIEPAKILGKYYFEKRKQKRKALGDSEEKGLVRRLLGRRETFTRAIETRRVSDISSVMLYLASEGFEHAGLDSFKNGKTRVSYQWVTTKTDRFINPTAPITQNSRYRITIKSRSSEKADEIEAGISRVLNERESERDKLNYLTPSD